MSVPYAKVIVNPVAGGGAVRKDWPRLSRRMRDAGLVFDHEFTNEPGHAIQIARRAADSGYGYLVAVGGDGTVSEVASGILDSINSGNTLLGIISAGTACSFSLSLGIAKDYAGACSLLTGRGRALIDVGGVRCFRQGQPVQRFFVNVAGAGFDSVVVDAWKHLPNRFGHKVNLKLRTAEGVRHIFTHRNKWIKFQMGDQVETIHGCAVIVANGSYFGDSMQIAPQARLNDGLLDVVVVGDVGKTELLKIWPTLYRGNHVEHPKVSVSKTATVTIESDEQLLIEADGNIIGESPASFWVIPAALTVVV
jgi:diacylglycerol kinase (ATP)